MDAQRDEVNCTTESSADLAMVVLESAQRLLSAPALSQDGQHTDYGDLVDRQFRDAIVRFMESDGHDLSDALAFAFVAGRIFVNFVDHSGSGKAPDPESVAFIRVAMQKLSQCLVRMATKAGISPAPFNQPRGSIN